MAGALTEEQELILSTVRKFVDKEVMPVASEMEHRNEYPHDLVRQMKEMGLFGLNVPEEYGGAEVNTTTFAMIFEEISRGWLGLAGVLGTHSVMCDVVARFASDEQKQRFLPGMATGEMRGGICLTESNAGTDYRISVRRRRAMAMYIASTARNCGLPTRGMAIHFSCWRRPIRRRNRRIAA